MAAYLRLREAYDRTRPRAEMVLFSATPADWVFLVARRSHSDYPRQLAIEVSIDGVSFATAWEGGVGTEMATSLAHPDCPPMTRLEVAPVPFKVARLRQTGQTPRSWFWSIDELELRGR